MIRACYKGATFYGWYCLAINSSVLFIGYSLLLTCFYTFFHRVKEPKRPARAKISHNSLLLTSRKRHPSFGCGAKAHSFVKLKLQSSQTLLARNGYANSFSFNHRGQKNSLFRQHQQQDEHRSNSICPFPLLERLFAVILSVPVPFLELPMLMFAQWQAMVIPHSRIY